MNTLVIKGWWWYEFKLESLGNRIRFLVGRLLWLLPRRRPCSRPTHLSYISKTVLSFKVHKLNNLATSMTTKILFLKELLRRLIHLLLRGSDGMSLNLNHMEIGFDS